MAGSTAYARIIDPLPFREIADSVGARFMFDAAHPAGLIAGGAHPSPVGVADVVTFTTHKTLRGPRGGAILCRPSTAKAVDSAVFPGLQGGPLEHVIAAKAVAFAEAARPEFRDYAAQVVANARALADALAAEGFRLVSGGTENHLVLVRPAHLRRRADRQGGPGGPRPGRHHLQPQHHPRRPPVAVRDLGPAAGHGGPDHRRAWATAEMAPDRRPDRPDAAPAGRRRPRWPVVRAEVRELCAGFPPYPALAGA